MKSLILLMAMTLVGGCASRQETESQTSPTAQTISWVSDPSDPNNVKIERAIRLQELEKPTSELTKADLEKLTQLKTLGLNDN